MSGQPFVHPARTANLPPGIAEASTALRKELDDLYIRHEATRQALARIEVAIERLEALVRA